MENQWQRYSASQHADLKEDWLAWLLYPHSFMTHLKEAGIQDSEVEVVDQSWQLPTWEESQILGIPPRQVVLVREVLIGNKKGTWMFARTVFPRTTLTGPERCLANLKNRSLGTLLFKNKNTLRSDFEICHITPGTDWHEHISQYFPLKKKTVWGRRSEFFIRDKNLLLTEVFLPDMKKVIESK